MLTRRRVDLDGATALVTGAGSGIGRATAVALAGSGTSVLCVDIDEVAARATAASCRDHGAAAEAHVCDVTDAAAMEALAATIRRDHGVLDVVVNNAGVGMSARLADMAPDDWEWIRSVNLDGVVNGCRIFGVPMAERGRGHVVNMSSGLAYVPRSTEIAYCTTKAAVLMFSRSLRADWRTCGVGVSAICPGVINTPILTRGRFSGPMWSEATEGLARRAFGWGHRPEVVADAVVHAIRANRAVVAPGVESRIGWHAQRVLPLASDAVVGRPPPHRPFSSA